jgi:hypothetical protein
MLLYDVVIQKSKIHQNHYDNKHPQSITPVHITFICNIAVYFSLCNTQKLTLVMKLS